MTLNGKKALVTGGSRGIGKAIALKLAEQGVDVVLHYHENELEAEHVRKQVMALGVQCSLISCDFSNPLSAINVGEEAWNKLGHLDILINNVGISYKTHFFDATVDDIDTFTNINFKSTLLLTQTVTRKMAASGIKGSVYTLTSINAIQPGVGLSIYGATKGALETLMKGIALELAPHHIKVNTIAAGAIKTDMTAAVWNDPERLALVSESIPFGRIGEPDEIANVVVSLLGADSYMTGSTIVIDGGWLANHGYNHPKPYQKP